MKLLTNPCNFKNAIDLIKFGIDQISIGESKFSTRNSCDINLKQIEKLTKIKNKTQILVLVNKFFFDPQLPELEKYLVSLAKLNIDGIIFSDYAVNQILFEHKIKINQIYSPETLVVNYGQFDFYKQNKITEVALARELTKLNIQKILLNKKNIKVQLQVCGYAFMM
jgi:collagenase-like PrtC family protease